MEEKKNILIVDDSSSNLLLLKELLADEGFETHTNKSGKDALNYLKKNSTDIIILDMMMPQVTGFEFLERIKEEEYKHVNAPIIVVSAVKKTHEIERAKNLGASEYLTKPVDLDKLIKTIHSYLK